MLKVLPKLKYCGITIILSNPSRFDKVVDYKGETRIALLNAGAGIVVNEALQPNYNVMQCEIRLTEDKSDFLPNTRCVILCGEYAMHDWCPTTSKNTLNEMRGSPLYVRNIPAIATFYPQDAADIKAFEQQHNENSKEYNADEEAGSEDEDEDAVKRLSRTRRSNYAFWLKQDFSKCKKLLAQQHTEACKWPVEEQPTYRLYPTAEEVIKVLKTPRQCNLYFDIETDYEEQNMLCFAFTFDGRIVYCVPVLDFNYRPAYSSLSFIIAALICAIKRNKLIAHNGSVFDFLVLAYKYNIPIYDVADTLVIQHRIFPDVEKSLGHCTSLWTYQQFHKDTDSKAYFTQQHLMDKLKYCGKDVFTMYLIHQAQMKFASTIPGMMDSINLANRSIRPYLTATVQGLRYDLEKTKQLSNENDRLMMQYNRIVNELIGPEGVAHCKTAVKSKKPSMIPGSNSQCQDYFHEQLGYKVMMRSKTTQKPSLGKNAMFKLALEYDNPVIRFILLFRILKKEYEALTFFPFKDDNNKVIKYVEEENS